MAEKSDFPPRVIAALLGVSERRLQQLQTEGWIPRGSSPGTYPMVGAVQGYIRFLRENGRATGRGAEHSRLARAQAVKVEMENSRRSGLYVLHTHVMDLLSHVTTTLVSSLESIPGRLANELATTNDPAVIRQRLQDEHRSVRRALADRVDEFAQSCQDRSDAGDDAAPAEEEDAGRVGQREPRLTSERA
jgi:hypothetical protein